MDGGCGLGQWTIFLTKQGYKVTGIDISKKTIEALAARFPGISFVDGDIRRTGFPEESYDAYVSWGTFEHFEDGLGETIREAHRILVKNGLLFITVPFQNERHIRRGRHALEYWDENYDPQVGYKSRMRFYQWRLTESELKRELEICGFKVFNIIPVNKSHGLSRMLRHDLHINPESLFGRILQRCLNPFIPKSYVSHMLLAICQRN